MKRFSLLSLFAGALLTISNIANATLITHNAEDFTNAQTPAFGALADEVGEFFIDSGVNYTFGNVEGVFNDPPAAFCGINANNECDLVTTVDGQIVQLGTTTQGLTSFIEVLAGNSAPGTLLLEVFDISMNLLDSAVNPSSGSSFFSVDRGGVADIAFFSVSGNDSYGVRSVTIAEPVSNVSAPSVALFSLLGFGLLFARKFSK